MVDMTLKIMGGATVVVACLAVLVGCDPANSLTNQDHRGYLDNYEQWQITDAVRAFNHLEEHRGEFNCQKQVDAARLASWREEGGPVKLDQTPEGKAVQACLTTFAGTIALKESPLTASVLQHWVNHTFMPAAQKALNDANEAAATRLGEKGCGGEQCELLTVVGDLAVPRVGQKVSVAFDDALGACGRANFGGLGPWRLPTKAELVALRESNKLVTDQDVATYWSGSREYDDAGQLQAYVLRFDVQVLGTEQQPKLLPFDREGVPSLAKVRCVSDLGKAPAASDDVARDEQALLKAGCKRGWGEYVRRREDLVVTWKVLSDRGSKLRRACQELSWCGLSWRAPGRSESKRLAEDAWFRESADGRCVATLPES